MIENTSAITPVTKVSLRFLRHRVDSTRDLNDHG
jgi:hypothetical protein